MSNATRTASMLQRVPRILEVTAHFYGLDFPRPRQPTAAGERQRQAHRKGARDGKPSA
jgi:hypothetical protein